MNQNEIIQGLVANSILLTAHIANEVSIQTKGESIVPEQDYLHLVKEFQVRIAKRIMPIRTQEDLKEEAKKFVTELIENSNKEEVNGESNITAETTVSELLSDGN